MIFYGTMAGCALLWARVWRRFGDPFHPLIYTLPMFGYLYGFMPLEIWREDPARFALYAGGRANLFHHGVVVGLILSFAGGVWWATRGITRRSAAWRPMRIVDPRLLQTVGLGIGCVAVAAWTYMILRRGGLLAAYGEAYGGGSAGSGYIVEMPYLGIVGATLIYLARVGRKMRPVDWALIAFCIAPVLLHAFLGARRGPTFMGLITVIGGYVYFQRRRVRLPWLIAGGLGLGLLMLFLVANRDDIYIGSEFGSVRNPLEFLSQWNSNEYLISNGTVRMTQEVGGFYGVREFIWIVARLLPSQIWPTVYSDLPRFFGIELNLWVNGGVDPYGVYRVTGWAPSIGSAEGFAASLWLEFQYAAPLVAAAIGYGYGRMWAKARTSMPARVLYLLMAALSVYLVMQSLDPWLFRLILLSVPAWLVLRTVRAQPLPQARGGLAEAGMRGGRPA